MSDPAANSTVGGEAASDVTAILVTFNSRDVIGESLAALRNCPNVAKVIVVDNASTDGTPGLIVEEFPDVELIANTDNVGFGAANNQGLERVCTEFGFVLNPDAVVSAEAVDALLQAAEQYPNAAIIGPLLETPGETRELYRTGPVWQPSKTRISPNSSLEVEFLSGAAMFMRMSLVRKSGFFDPQIFLFYEDDDICRSARRSGYTLVLTSRARITHLVGQSTPPKVTLTAFKQCHFTWSRLYFEQKEHGRAAGESLACSFARKLTRKRILATMTRDRRKRTLIKARQLAVQDFLNGKRPTTDLRQFSRQVDSTVTQRQGGVQMELAPCDLCDQTEFEQIADIDRLGASLSTVICKSCGLVRHAEVPTEQELQEFYSTDYREAYNGERVPGARRIMRAWNNGKRICSQVAPLLQPGSRVLEVGAGIGCTVKVFEKAGFAAQGIDPGGEFLKFSRDKLHTDVEIRNLYDLPQESQFDAVLLIHVIEHLRSPKQALRHIAGLIKPGGMFYVECPNLQAPFARRSKLFHTAHIHNYNPSTLQMLAQSCGFRLRKRFGDEQDTNLQMLFQHSGEECLDIDSENYAKTLSDLGRTDLLPYHLRLRYVTDRTRKVGSYLNEMFQAKAFVEDLIRECDEEHTGQQAGRKAA